MNKVHQCMNCPSPATLVNHTQFAGTHYWCEQCVPPQDKPECARIKTCTNLFCDCAPGDCIRGYSDARKTITVSIADDPQLQWHQQTQYLLDKLQEEAAEVIQAVSKIRRFGPNNHHPDRTQTNLEELTGELEDFQAIVWALEEIKYLDPKPSTTATIKKYQQLTSS